MTRDTYDLIVLAVLMVDLAVHQVIGRRHRARELKLAKSVAGSKTHIEVTCDNTQALAAIAEVKAAAEDVMVTLEKMSQPSARRSPPTLGVGLVDQPLDTSCKIDDDFRDTH